MRVKQKINKRVFIIHGWGGNPRKDWLPWAKSQIEDNGDQVIVPSMPDTDNPQIKQWVSKLIKSVGQPTSNDILIGHSIGCQTILRFLAGLPINKKIDKVIMIAPWLKLTNLENDEAWRIADPWLKTPIDLTKVEPKAGSFTAIFSDNDPWVPLKENREIFEKKLKPKVIVLSHRGHFTQEEGVKELPEILSLL